MEPEVTETIDTPIDASDIASDEPRSMEDTAREAYREIMARNAEQPENDEEPAEQPATGQRARGPDGKFVKHEATEQPAEQLEQPAQQPQQTFQAPDPAKYPSSWRKGMENDWATLPPAVRQEIYKREQDFLEGLKQYREPAAFGQAIGQEMLPHVDTMRQIGITPQQLTKELMSAWSTLATGSPDQKRQLILQLAAQSGIDISSAAPQATTSQQPQTAVALELAPVLQRVQSIEQMVRQQQEQQARIASEQAQNEVQVFASKPEHKHFAAVQHVMAQLVGAGQATNLNDAYDKAIWMVPEVRQQLLAEQDQKRQADEAAKAAAARKAAAVNVAKRGTAPTAPKTGSMEDTIREAYRRLQAT